MNAVAVLLALLACGASAADKGKEEGSERMRVEMDAAGGQTAEMAAKEAEAMARMDQSLKDTLTDIMAVLQHGSDPSKDQAIGQLINIALETSEAGADQARMFRSAVVAGGALPALIGVLGSSEAQRQFLAARALHALSIDDPTTELDNFHSEEICQHGVRSACGAQTPRAAARVRTSRKLVDLPPVAAAHCCRSSLPLVTDARR